jgi:hypothetical protein
VQFDAASLQGIAKSIGRGPILRATSLGSHRNDSLDRWVRFQAFELSGCTVDALLFERGLQALHELTRQLGDRLLQPRFVWLDPKDRQPIV